MKRKPKPAMVRLRTKDEILYIADDGTKVVSWHGLQAWRLRKAVDALPSNAPPGALNELLSLASEFADMGRQSMRGGAT